MKTRKKIDKNETFRRDSSFEYRADGEESRTIEVAFSSETEEVERWFGIEILDHDEASIRLGRLKNDAPLLMDHNPKDQIGKVESVRIDSDRVARAVVRFGKSARASEIFQDVVDGIRSKISVGYRVYSEIQTDEGTENKPVIRINDWEPTEISIVSIAADDGVGVGRSADDEINLNQMEKEIMKDKEVAPAAPEFDAAAERQAIQVVEVGRINDIRSIGERRNVRDLADEFITKGKSVDEFRQAVLDKLDDTPAESPARHADIQMNDAENDAYSVVRAIAAASSGDWSKAGREREMSEEIGKQLNRTTDGIFVPTNLRHTPEMVARQAEVQQRAGLDTLTGAAGGYNVATSVGSLIDLLRNKMMVRQMGARVLSGLEGDMSFPTLVSGSAFSWVAENPGSDEADSDAVFGQVNMSPNSGMSTTAYSKQMIAQSSLDIEALVRDDLTQSAALGIDLAALHGTGASNQPEGIINVSGIGDVAGGTNGLIPTWGNIVALETDIAVANADLGSMGYLTNAAVRGILKTTEKAASTGQFIWDDGANGFGTLNGYRAAASGQVAGNLTKGSSSGICSAIFFGNWNDLLIGEWGAMEILVDPYALKKQAMVEVTSFCMVDIAVRHPQSFSVMKDALTA